MRQTIAVSILLLSACSQQAPQQAPPQAPQPVEQVAATPVAVDRGASGGAAAAKASFKAARLRNPLPEGLELPFAYHRLNDNTVKAGAPGEERRVYVEIRQVTPLEAEGALARLLLQKGFIQSGDRVARNVREINFSRDDGVKLTVKINPRRPKPEAPDATGTLHLVWQAPGQE